MSNEGHAVERMIGTVRPGRAVSRVAAGALLLAVLVAPFDRATAQSDEVDPLLDTLLGALEEAPSDVVLGVSPTAIPTPPRAETDPVALSDLDSRLIEAARSGDLAQVQSAIRAGANIDAIDEKGATALGWAASNGHAETVRALIDAGADIHWQAERGQTALNVAAAQGHVDILRMLLDAGVGVNERITGENAPNALRGATPLFVASYHGQLATTKALIRSGADVNASNEEGSTPLFLAAETGNDALGRALIAAGANASIRNERGATPLIVAAGSDSAEMIWLLTGSGADPNATTSDDNPPPFGAMTALMFAAHTGSERAVLALILVGVDAGTENSEGQTASSLAAKQDHRDIVELLRNPGEARRAAHQTFVEELFEAAMEERWETVRLLVENGVEIDGRDDEGVTALMKAVEKDSIAAVEGLLDAGAGMHGTDAEYGATPLMMAAFSGQSEITRVLIAAGMDTNKQARGNDKGEAAGWTALMLAASEGHADIVSKLLDAGADPRTVNAVGQTALEIAKDERKGASDEVIALLEAAEGGATAAEAALGACRFNDSAASIMELPVGPQRSELEARWEFAYQAEKRARALIKAAQALANAGKLRRARDKFAEAKRVAPCAQTIAAIEGAIGWIKTRIAGDIPGSDPARKGFTRDFETGDLRGWAATGDAFTHQPTYGDNPTARGRGMSSKHQGDYWIGSYERRSRPADPAGKTQGDGPTGTLTSLAFTIDGPSISFLVGGGCDIKRVRVELLIEGKIVREATGKCHETMERMAWDVSEFLGRQASIRLVDESSGGWGHINVDDVRF